MKTAKVPLNITNQVLSIYHQGQESLWISSSAITGLSSSGVSIGHWQCLGTACIFQKNLPRGGAHAFLASICILEPLTLVLRLYFWVIWNTVSLKLVVVPTHNFGRYTCVQYSSPTVMPNSQQWVWSHTICYQVFIFLLLEVINYLTITKY